ncbi:hypothetical protein FB565_001065 [Actinoplanes lutulentus]|uniref:Dolichyl-phosphate-mannose-protein mannosyltransferase n=1 Tax=Actinoplanes lutulentus TaxID=1287878 RepID=A0A327ZBR9_9ACTN|nr:ABC transporter [Actinoplanes lutulentus]MBB2941361.1 hypothetical protein [Actinoplanes lutulentus]RAK36853.1 hypothetical protein B0I29_107115 [Actinoplanes lutulentus]
MTLVDTPVKTRKINVVVLVTGILYLGIAIWFWRYHLMPGDSSSRLANAYYTIFSRDPHLAAIGFVWNPLPSLLLIPFLPLTLVFPALTQESLLAVLASAALMTATVGLFHSVIQKIVANRALQIALTAAFALHPMTLLYAGNGMSEACFLFTLMLAVRSLHLWLVEKRVEQLVPLGLALALSYGARYEALAPLAAVTALVAAITWWRSGRNGALARTDAVIVGLPGLLAVALWALASKIIVGQWFATFSSQYGNSAQVSTSAADIGSVTGDDLAGRLSYWGHQMTGLAPFAAILLIAALAFAWHRRDLAILAPITVLGSVLAFDAMAFLSGTSFGWLRFHIAVVPLAVLLAAHLIADARQRFVTAASLVLVLAAFPTMFSILSDSNLSREEAQWVTESGRFNTSDLHRINTQVASDLDAMNLPDGAVLTDVAYAFGVVLASDNPDQFVITPDRDFAAAVADPTAHHIQYLLLSADGSADAVRLARYGPTPVPLDNATPYRDAQGGVEWFLVKTPF